jgi:trehalose synthase
MSIASSRHALSLSLPQVSVLVTAFEQGRTALPSQGPRTCEDRGLHADETGAQVQGLREVEIPSRALSRLQPLIGQERYTELQHAAASARRQLRGRTIWNISSTATGGGVAEMLQVLVGYTLDAQIDIRWLVMEGDHEFFGITKRIHNRIHGVPGDVGALGPAEAEHYRRVTADNAAQVDGRIKAGDVVLLHDPQPLGMAPAVSSAGALVVWRCHIGREHSNEWTEQAWAFLRPALEECMAYVFSLREYAPSWLDASKTWVIPPSIDPFSAKNQALSEGEVLSVLRLIGLMSADGSESPVRFTRLDGTHGTVQRRATVVSEGPPIDPALPLFVQVSRWDRLKDMRGVMLGFASNFADLDDAYLALVGPEAGEVADDPEGAEVYAECVEVWKALPEPVRRRVRLVSLPMDDTDENALMVNALQRGSKVIVQKSLAEGFGLTVAEGMWKSKAVVASRLGGIAAQVAPMTGILLDDPTDLQAFGRTLVELLARPSEIDELGVRARAHVLDSFVGDKHLMRYGSLLGALVSG